MLDYLEGRLSAGEEQQMKQFLSGNPDIEEEVNDYDTSFNIRKITSSIPKSTLIKSFSDITSVSPENFQEFCVAYYEGDLDAKSSSLLKGYLELHSELKGMFEFYGRLKFTPDQQVRFPNKMQLKKQVISIRRRISIVAAGVAAAVFFSLLIIWQGNIQPFVQVISQEKQISPKKMTSLSYDKLSAPNHSLAKNTFAPNRIINRQREQLAAIDSNTTRQHEKVILASMQPILPSIKKVLPGSEDIEQVTIESPQFSEVNIPQDQQINKPTVDKQSRIYNIRNNLLWSALHFSINSINSLTENDLALHTEKNSSGKLSEIALQNDNFEITRKIGRNMQN